MTVCITGWRSAIAEEFRPLIDDDCIRIDWRNFVYPETVTFPDIWLFAHGLLMPKREEDQSVVERDQSWFSNHISVASACDVVLDRNPRARICVIGSESAYKGSFDGSYAKAKASLHLYVELKRLKRDQQLVAISPGIIADAGMTTRRTDLGNLDKRRSEHRMGRFITAREVAEMAWFLLTRAPFVSNTVVRMHG